MAKARRYAVIKIKLRVNLCFTAGMYKRPLDWTLSSSSTGWLVVHAKLEAPEICAHSDLDD